MPFYMHVLWRVAYHIVHCFILWCQHIIKNHFSTKVSSTKMRTGEARISLLHQKDMPKQKKYQTVHICRTPELTAHLLIRKQAAAVKSWHGYCLILLDSLILGTRVTWTPYCSHSSACPRSQTTCWSRASSGRGSPSTPFWSTLMLGCFSLYTILKIHKKMDTSILMFCSCFHVKAFCSSAG